MAKRDLLKKIEELKKMQKMKTGGLVFISESNKGLEYINVNGKDYLDHEALAVLRTFTEDSIIIFDNMDVSWDRRTISDDYKEMIFFPTVEDRIDYIRVNKGIKPLYHDDSEPYHTITRKEWLDSYKNINSVKDEN
ncbi:hypothetical protein HMPREF3108_01700 [Streptococcus sp. HMSC10A01]|uniref:hypothetical protein n=1 Tax=Streptococcus sp. HMSC10A01 TaxID=1581076 RepID=UPI0008A34038|nr:hypothetical protein [Streptococcus sp. HMSC10A01]OFU72784.1 hypothetical protein HMPREF3108_01700 [Streptococcus sp. HMSC10A01]